MDYGLIVDVETTGLDPQKDHIIEIGLLRFAVEGKNSYMVGAYGGLQEAPESLDPKITSITGLTDPILKGQRIDWELVRAWFSEAAIIVAHNAPFDRSFIERRAELEGIHAHWACSCRHIDWQKHGYQTQALNYLAADHGFVNPFAHRALFDCATTFRLILPYLEELIARSYEKEYLFSAYGASFNTKDALREKGYRWDPTERVWQKVIPQSQIEDERSFLREKIYGDSNLDSHEEKAL